jgi:hypothetical protein
MESNNSPAAEQDNVAHDFDADTYFKSEGMTFVKKNDDGTAHVAYDDGSEGVFDPKEFARTHGMEPAKDFDVTYNSPDAPVNESPVGFVDRFKMSLGNTKGSVGYLKTKFPDATVDASGDLVVKDSGVWKRVDLAGISGDDGWKVSEILGDVADVGGDLLVGAGSIASMAATGGGSALALAAGGSGVAGAVKGVLGRVAGTYDASPEEFVKDVLIDTAMGLGGEAVMLGGKAVLGPTLKKGLASLSKMGEATQDLLAKGIAAIDPENPAGIWRTVLAEPEAVIGRVEQAAARAAKEVTSVGADAAAPGMVSDTMTTAVGRVLAEDAVTAARPLIEETQLKTSKWFGGEIKTILDETLDKDAYKEIDKNLPQYGQEAVTQIKNFLTESKLLKETSESAVSTQRNASSMVARNGGEPVKSTVNASTLSFTKKTAEKELVTAKSMAAWAKDADSQVADPSQFGPLAKAVNEMHALADRLSKGVKNPKDLIDLMQLSKSAGDTFEEALAHLPRDSREALEPLLKKRLGNIDTAVEKMLPKKMQARYNTARGNYREVAANVRKVTAGLDAKASSKVWDDSAVQVLNHFKNTQGEAASTASIESHNILKALKTINENGGAHLRNVQHATAAMAFGGSSVAPALSGSGAISRTAAAVAKKGLVSAGMSVSKLQRRASLKAFLHSEPGKQFMAATRALKAGGRTIAQKPELVAAGLTTALSALRQR